MYFPSSNNMPLDSQLEMCYESPICKRITILIGGKSMKKGRLFVVLSFAIVAAPVFGQDTSVNVNSYVIPELPVVPIIDGDLSDSVWANAPTIPIVYEEADPPLVSGSGDLDIVVRAAWDDETNALYFALNIIDESFINAKGIGSSLAPEGWHNERLEIIIDGLNTGEASSTCTSGYHQQYTFDMANNWDANDPDNGMYGFFDAAGVPVSTEFISVPVYENLSSTFSFEGTEYPFNFADDFVESAAMIRATDPNADKWSGAPVEYSWEVKLAVFEFLDTTDNLEYDIQDPANIAGSHRAYFEHEFNEVNDLEENEVIGFSPQINDADDVALIESPGSEVFENQVNTTGFGNWNSSENLTGLILGPTLTGVADWTLK